MKKRILYISLLIILIIIVLTTWFFVNKNKDNKESKSSEEKVKPTYDKNKDTNDNQNKLAQLDHINKKIDYFDNTYIDRYISYKNSNPDLALTDVITRVNIGLDYSYYENTKAAPNQQTNLILVNKYNYLDENYVPNNLVEIYEGYSLPGKYAVKEAADSFYNMAKAAASENLTIRAMSAYRDYKYQVGLYNRYKSSDGQEAADTYSARAGYSEHQTGLAIDIDNNKVSYTSFENTSEYNWMINNSYKFGFILRYPKGKENITGYSYESWHYRYVGVKVAEEIKNKNITFDEYIAQTKKEIK